MQTIAYRFFLLIIAVFSVAFMLSCSKKKSGDLLCYTSIPLEIMTEMELEFEKSHAGVQVVVKKIEDEEGSDPDSSVNVKVYREGTGHVVAKLAAEREAGGIKADILWIAEPSYYYELKAQDYLLAYQSQYAADIPEQFRDKDMEFWGARVFAMVITYNVNKVTDPPRTWLELQDPKWMNKVIIANPSYSGASVICVGALAKKYGWEYIEALRKNNIAVVNGNTVVAAKVASGEFLLGVTSHNIVSDMKKEGSPIDAIYPEDGYVVITSPIAIFSTSDKKELAGAFIDFVLSPLGQKILVEKGNYMPVRADIAGPTDVPPREELIAKSLDTEWMRNPNELREIKSRFEELVMH